MALEVRKVSVDVVEMMVFVEREVILVFLVNKVLLDQEDLKVFQAKLVLLALLDLLDLKVYKAFKAYKAFKVFLVKLVLLVLRDYKEMMDLLEYKDQ